MVVYNHKKKISKIKFKMWSQSDKREREKKTICVTIHPWRKNTRSEEDREGSHSVVLFTFKLQLINLCHQPNPFSLRSNETLND